MGTGHEQIRAARRRAEKAAERSREDDVVRSVAGRGESFAAVFQRRLSRRGFLKTGAEVASLVVAPRALSGTTQTMGKAPGPHPSQGIKFRSIAPQPSSSQSIRVAEGHGSGVLLAWGDPIDEKGAPFDLASLTGAEQKRRFGYNCDYIGWSELPGTGTGILWVNHEYTDEEIMFLDYDPANPTKEQVDIALAAHGGRLVEPRHNQNGRMRVELGSKYNRRIDARTEMRITGPPAGHDWMTTKDDPTGTNVLGMLNDCVDAANPQPENRYGHIIEMTEEGDDAAAERFTWDIFILRGDPADESTYFAGYPKDSLSPIANPDNVNFDSAGNLWISSDGQPSSLDLADDLFAVPTEGEQRGNLQQFLAIVAGAECASFEFTTDNRGLFVSVQHPGEGGAFEDPISLWPHDGSGVARTAVIQVWAENGGRIGQQ